MNSISIEQRRSNLALLAKSLLTDTFQKEFSMLLFAQHRDPVFGRVNDEPNNVNECSTCCCALGHAPLVIGDTRPDENWWSYSDRIMPFRDCLGEDEYEWEFLFDQCWPDSKEQFAARAYHYLTGQKINYDKYEVSDARREVPFPAEYSYPVVSPDDFDQFIIP